MIKWYQRELSSESDVFKDLVVGEQGSVGFGGLSDFLCDYMDSKPIPQGKGRIKFLSSGASNYFNRSIIL